jgi:hypothetical protein
MKSALKETMKLLRALFCWIPLAGAVRAHAEGDFVPKHTAVHVLSSPQLQLEVMDPNDPARYNVGHRFSPVANVLRVVRDGKDFLFSPVAHDPIQDNGGMAMEFDLSNPHGAPGFAEAPEGGEFVKIGVGVLRKHGTDYHKWTVVSPAVTDVVWEPSRAVFHQVCDGTNGYAYALEATVSVEQDTVSIQYRLHNTGTKSFVTEQYAHNFLLFNDTPVGPGYEIEFPYDFQVANPGTLVRKGDRTLVFGSEIPPAMRAVNAQVTPGLADAVAPPIVIRCVSAGMEVIASVSQPVFRIAIHATTKYFCPEQFVRIALGPGETFEWTRKYQFLTTVPSAPASAPAPGATN